MPGIEPHLKDPMRQLAEHMKDVLPEGTGFCLLTFDMGKPNKNSRMNYISNGTRETMAAAMLEFVCAQSNTTLVTAGKVTIDTVRASNQPWKDTLAELEAIRDYAEDKIEELRNHYE